MGWAQWSRDELVYLDARVRVGELSLDYSVKAKTAVEPKDVAAKIIFKIWIFFVFTEQKGATFAAGRKCRTYFAKYNEFRICTTWPCDDPEAVQSSPI